VKAVSTLLQPRPAPAAAAFRDDIGISTPLYPAHTGESPGDLAESNDIGYSLRSINENRFVFRFSENKE